MPPFIKQIRILFLTLLPVLVVFVCAQGQVNPNKKVPITQNSPQSCNNWLGLPSSPSSVTIGELDIPGDKITVEAMINRTAPYTGGNLYAGDIVSKHDGPPDVNYLLRPNSAEITTTNGYFITPEICAIELNKTYHVAMVYDGSTLKFYRNGFLMSQVAATGNLIQNDWPLRIGYVYNQLFNTNFIGYINEVRIWNTVRTQTDIRNYMNSSLPSPTTQTGLLAYYTFDNLLNKQGNPAWNGTLGGSAFINQVNPNCSFVPDTCGIVSPISGIINSYTEVVSLDICKNILNVSDATEFNVGDTVIIVQMKGAIIDETNSAAFGTLVNYRNAGNYEFNYISQINGNEIVLRNELLRTYDVPDGIVQLVRVPYYISATVTSELRSRPWNGRTGGILALNVRDTLILKANMDVSGQGFAGGKAINSRALVTNCSQNDYNYPSGSNLAAPKGESIISLSSQLLNGKGAPASGGGGGVDHNSGGGGGGNGGKGGFGGYQLEACTNTAFDNRGIGGASLNNSNARNSIFLGGGGGAGHCNQPLGENMDGGNGGGIIILRAGVLMTDNIKILAKGANAVLCNLPNIDNCHDGSGGGGGGGTILIETNKYLSSTVLDASGGKGGDLVIFNNVGGGRIGPGGGGGGGVIWLNAANKPTQVNSINLGGLNGVILLDNNNPWGTTPGQPGINLFNLKIPLSTLLFEKNIDSLRLVDSMITCKNVRFHSTVTTHRYNIASWHWNFGDGVDMVSQTGSLTHVYASGGTYPVKLVVTDTKGCQDSVMISVIIEDVTANISPVSSLCVNQSVTLNGSGGNIYSWTPAQYLNDSTVQNPVANPPVTTRFYLKVRNTNHCYDTASILVTVVQKPVFNAPTAQNAACEKTPLQLNGNNGTQYTYAWSPSTFLNDPTSANPVATPDSSITYTIRISESVCNYDSNFSLPITVNPNPIVTARKINDIDCSNHFAPLQASGALNYVWSPAIGLDNPNKQNPIATLSSSATFIVTGTNRFGCSDSDTVSVKVTTTGKPIFEVPNAFTPNGDGKNECFGIKKWGNVTVREFSVFNRWGQLVFTTKDPTQCWDGTINGQKQATGGYTYVILANSFCGDIKKTGIVMLIR